MSADNQAESAAKPSKVHKGLDKIKDAPKNIGKGVARGGSGVGKGANAGVAGVNKGISGAARGFRGSDSGSEASSDDEPLFQRPSRQHQQKQSEMASTTRKTTAPPSPSKRKLNSNLATFDWESIGYYREGVDRGDGDAILAKSEAMKTYLSDAYFSDYYMNTVLIIGTCFFAWAVARLGGGILSLGLVWLGAASVYRAEIRRFVRDAKDDMVRLSILDRLEHETETLEWCNSLLSKVWIIYMPLMGDLVRANVNPVLAGAAPGNGIDSVELAHFHLGSVAPKVTAIKSYTKIGKSAYEMDWALAFDPNNRENMTKVEIRKQIMPKVVLKAALGKGLISKKVPINVEDMGFVGRMKIRLTFTDKFPMIEFVRIQFLEPPKIDYALKPIGGDTLGLDIMKFIPGLKSLINEGINWAIKSFLISPNYQEVNLVEIMGAQSTDLSSVLVVHLKDVTVSQTANYYAVLATENSGDDKKIRTDTIYDTKNPSWNKTFYLLNNLIEQKLLINLYKKGSSFGKDRLVGTAEFDLSKCYQEDRFDSQSVKVQSSGKKAGFANFDLQYYPEIETPKLEDGSKGPTPESEVGILKFVLNEAKGLDVSSSAVGQLSPYAKVFVNGKLKHKTRVLKRSNEPSFGDVIEMLISSKSESSIKVVIKDSVGFAEDPVLGEYEGTLEEILTQVANSGNPLFKLSPKGVIKVTPTWRPLAMTEIASEVSHREPLGALRVHLREAIDLKNFHGKVDPYVKVSLNGKVKYQTVIHEETLVPVFEEVAYLPITSENQFVSLDVFDAEKNGRDRPLGSTSFRAEEFMKRAPRGNYYYVDGREKVTKAPLSMPKAKNSKGYLYYSVSFLPTTPVYNPKEIEDLKKEDVKIRENLKKEEEEQAKLKKLAKKKPKAYEWVEVESPLSHRDPLKRIIPLEELVQYNSGVLSVNIIRGSLKHKKAFLSVLVDELAYPGQVVGPASNGLVSTSFGGIFIRDLKNSQFVLREASKEEVEEPEDVHAEKTFPTLDILKKAYREPVTLSITEASHVTLQVTYNPSIVEVPPEDTMLDTGKITVDILNGENLISADSNGKSDPFARLKLNGALVVKTEIQKKTLNPKWNEEISFPLPSLSRTRLTIEVQDWDMAGDNDDLGEGLVDLSGVKPDGEPVKIEVPLTLKGQAAGRVFVSVAFEPQYIRPQVKKFGGGLPGIGSVTKAPAKLVGGVAKGALGGVGFLAGGVGKGGHKIIDTLGGGSKEKKSKKRQSQHSEKNKNNGTANSQSQSTTYAESSQTGADDVLSSATANGTVTTNNTRSDAAAGGGVLGAGTGVAAVGTIASSSANGGDGALSKSATNKSKENMFGGKRSPGKLTIKELVALNENYQTLQLKVLLKNNDLGTKELCKTRRTKLQGSGFKFGDEVNFKAIPEDTLLVEAIKHHRLGRDEKVGEAQVAVASTEDNTDDMTVKMANIGNLVLNFRYSAPDNKNKQGNEN